MFLNEVFVSVHNHSKNEQHPIIKGVKFTLQPPFGCVPAKIRFNLTLNVQLVNQSVTLSGKRGYAFKRWLKRQTLYQPVGVGLTQAVGC